MKLRRSSVHLSCTAIITLFVTLGALAYYIYGNRQIKNKNKRVANLISYSSWKISSLAGMDTIDSLSGREQEEEFDTPATEYKPRLVIKHAKMYKEIVRPPRPVEEVELWSKAAIGNYLWKHILGQITKSMLGGVWYSGNMDLHLDKNFMAKIRYRSGIGVHPSKVNGIRARATILVINGHDEDSRPLALQWLRSILNFSITRILLVVHGPENCKNDWLYPFISMERVKRVFLVYGDTSILDHPKVSLWPLGVATYRNFPVLKKADITDIDLDQSTKVYHLKRRRHLCNFLGTVYPKSSREVLRSSLEKSLLVKKHCIVRIRDRWISKETHTSAKRYIDDLINSELTLSPSGHNSECYRILEAASAGSVPVVEDVVQPPQCGVHSSLALFKQSRAPFIYVKNWSLETIERLLQNQILLTPEQAHNQRINILNWHRDFLRSLKNNFSRSLLETIRM